MRRVATVLTAGLLSAVLSGCSGEPPPTAKRWESQVVPYTYQGKTCLITLAWDGHPTSVDCDWQPSERQE